MVALALWHLTLAPGDKVPILLRRDLQITNASFGREVTGEERSVVVVQHQPVNPRYLVDDSDSDDSYDSDEELYSEDEEDEDEEDLDEEEAEAKEIGETSKLTNGSVKSAKGKKEVVKGGEEEDEDMEELDDDEDDDDEDDEDFEDDEEEFEEAVVCALIPGKIEQANLNLTFTADEVIVFEVTGPNEVHLMGNYIDQTPVSEGPRDDYDELMDSDDDEEYDEDDEDDSEEEEFDEEEEAQMDAYFAKLAKKERARIEPVEEDEKKPIASLPTKKRKASNQDPNDSTLSETVSSAATTAVNKISEVAKSIGDAVTGSGAAAAETAATKAEGLSKNAQKKLAKKLKNEDGKAVEADVKKVEKAAPKEEKKTEKKAPSKKTLPGGLIVEDLKVGDGPVAKSGKRLGMRYIGKLQNGKQFDANTTGPTFNFRLGGGEVIKGWDQGLVGMAVGGERRLTIPPALAYGSSKTGGIPPNSTLTFDVKLVNVK